MADFSLISLGCARTLVDSEALVQSIQSVGFTMVPEGTKESVTVLNTCSFIQAAIDETEDNIRQLIDRKKSREIAYICVVGCYPSRFKEPDLKNKFPEVDIWCPTSHEKTLHIKMAELIFNRKFMPAQNLPYTKISPSHYAYLKISEGCDNWCSFCTIPKIRGTHTSKSIEAIRQDATIQIAMGAKELIIIAEDTTAWGDDIYGAPCLERLLKALSDLPVWIRLMYIFPSRVTPELIECMANTPNLIPYIDMPIQHVNSDLLSAMNRRHDRAFLERIVTDMRSAIPDLSIRTTFICGFPGETDAHVDEICDFITTHRMDQVGAFTYSRETDTRSNRLNDHVPTDVAQDRLHRIMTHYYKVRGSYQLTQVGQVRRVLYEGKKIGRSVHEAPDVDNVIVMENAPEDLIPGAMVSVKLTGVSGIDYTGKIIHE